MHKHISHRLVLYSEEQKRGRGGINSLMTLTSLTFSLLTVKGQAGTVNMQKGYVDQIACDFPINFADI